MTRAVEILTCSQFAAGLFVLAALFFVSAPYGKHSRSGWGPRMDSRLAWLVMELPAVFTILCIFILSPGKTAFTLYLVALWEIHYVYRTFIYPFRMRGPRKTFPVVLVAFAFLFNVNNGIINGFQSVYAPGTAGPDLAPARLALGTLLFVSGFLTHLRSDEILRGLRGAGDSSYAIPLGGLYTYVSNPNYLGEIVQWAGWAVIAGTAAGWAFAFFTLCNLLPRAVSNHRWYRKSFPDYPRGRKVLIPFIF